MRRAFTDGDFQKFGQRSSSTGQKGPDFFGVQGPWYTVGYKMAVAVEKRYGRAALIDCMRDRRLLLVRYSAVTEEMNSVEPSRRRIPRAADTN